MLTAAACEGFVTEYLLDRYPDSSAIKWFHREWWQMVCDPYPKVAIAAPRGHSKTTTVNIGYSMAGALLRLDPFQIKISRTRDVAKQFLGAIKGELTDNQKLIDEFGILPPKEWPRDTEDEFICRLDDGYEFCMKALGAEQPMRGSNFKLMRPTSVTVDDGEDDEQVLSAERRAKWWHWFMSTLMPIGTIFTKYRVIGTILHSESGLKRLTEMSGWKSKIYEACDDEVSAESLMWPEKFPREAMLAIKQDYIDSESLINFNMEYRNIALDTSSGYFQTTDFVATDETDAHKERRRTRYVGGDFAISTAERRDYTVFVVGSVDEDGLLVIDEIRKGRWDGKRIIDEMISIEEAWRPEQWFVESGAIQKALGPALEHEMRERNLFLNLNPMVPTKDKASRARSIQARMRAHGVRFDKRHPWFPDLEQEMLQFPRGRHDDQVDAMAWLGLGLSDMVYGKTEREEEQDMRAEVKRARQEQTMRFGIGGRSNVTGY